MGESTWSRSAAWDASKLRIPKEAVFELRREKLLSSIAGGNESAVVFHAGAGYGKTTVMAEWASGHRAQSCWYRLHESDNQFGRFLYGLASALSGVADAAFFDTDAMKTAEREKPEQAGERFFARCLPALPAEQVFICLDDVHLIRNEAVLDFLLRFMEYGEGRARFFFTSKCGFPDFLAANLVRGRAREVAEDELRFEESETALLLRKISGRELSARVVREIHTDMHGWPAGIAFAGLELKNTRTPFAGAPAFDRTHLFQYIFYEIFRKQAYDTQRFLTESSVLETITPALCDCALGRSDSAGMLRYLVREHLFLSRMEGKEDTYFYEGFFGGFLRNRLSDGRRSEILIRAAQYHVRRGEWEAAVRDAMACGEKGSGIVAAVFVKNAAQMSASGKQGKLWEWIDHLAKFQESLTDTTLFCMYECLYRDGERVRGAQFLREAAKKAYAKLRYDRYERYMRELAGVMQAHWGEETAAGENAARMIEAEARERLGARGIVPERWDVREEVLYVQCMGPFTVRGKIGEAVWRTKKTKELFACLFFENARWTSKDVLMERLWPEKPADKAAVLFHTTVSYLRKTLDALGASELLFVKNQSYALNTARLNSDIRTLENWYQCLKSGKVPEKELSEKLPTLYGQGLMYGEDYLWLDGYREEAEQRCLWMLRALAGRAAAGGRYEEAVVFLKKAVEVDGFALDAMEKLVECLLRCRDITGAKRAYERLTEMSLELLGEVPERAFEEFIR